MNDDRKLLHALKVISLLLLLVRAVAHSSRDGTAAAVSTMPGSVSLQSPASCDGRRVYMHELPPQFNVGLMFDKERDSALEEWYAPNMLLHLDLISLNNGFGRPISPVASDADQELQGIWYETDQYAMERIFHVRMRDHKCRVMSYSEADMIYIPYYGAHDALRHMHKDVTSRDRLAVQLLQWLQAHPAWQRHQGADHFLVLGKDVWDFIREGPEGWGSQLLAMKASSERIWTVCSETHPGMRTVMSAPRPVAFHPQTSAQLKRWQDTVQAQERKWLFAFAGGRRRKESEAGATRDSLFWQCEHSSRCNLIDCTVPHLGKKHPCEDIRHYLGLYLSSTFCLHPVGDSCSRRSVLDGMLAGCIPVVFKACSLEDQLWWHSHSRSHSQPHSHSHSQSHPQEGDAFFVHIPAESVRGPGDHGLVDKVLVEEVLANISLPRVLSMRRRIVDLIPRLVYGGRPDGEGFAAPDFQDAVDVTIEGLSSSMRGNSAWQKLVLAPEQGSSLHALATQ